MNSLRQLTSQILRRVWLVACLLQLLAAGTVYAVYDRGYIEGGVAIIVGIVASILTAFLIAKAAASTIALPLDAVTRAVLHTSPSERGVPAPKLESIGLGRTYVTELVQQIQALANIPIDQALGERVDRATQASDIIRRLPFPVFVLNKSQQVTFATDIALGYSETESAELFGKPLYETLTIEFSSAFTLESWIADCQQNKATDTAYWQRVQVYPTRDPKKRRQCDMAGHYNRDNSKGIEFIITLFDRTNDYDYEDESVNFIALAVHELRTPLTIMHGYIEAFQDELGDTVTGTTAVYMDRLQASARQLSAFVNNILNVARIQENQLSVTLAEETWSDIVDRACQDMTIQARAHGKTITKHVEDGLPAAAADRVTIYEVMCNLLDNAIKYSGTSTNITITSRLNNDRMIETAVHDDGVGIPANILPTLFEKFHRNHRNRSQISGTGLGLYISQAIIEAHNGSIWVNSTEGKGSTFTFTVPIYASLDTNGENSNNGTMTRTAHGWIKNHSLYRK